MRPKGGRGESERLVQTRAVLRLPHVAHDEEDTPDLIADAL